MGMLEIRRSSARLNNLGQFRMPELDNGSARAFAAQAEAAKSAAAAARVAGHAKMEGIMRRGQIVARTLGDLGRMAVELANRENERIATNAVLQSENDRNLYMTGDGTPENPGQLNIRQGKDGEWHAEEWLNDIKRAAEARREKFTKDLNGPQRRMYDEMVAKRDVAWNARIFAHAAKTTLDAEIATATAALAQAKEKAIGDFDVGAARESSIQEMYDAKEREMNARQVPESLRAAEMKSLTEDFLVNFAKTKFTAWENETFDSADPEAVADAWDKKSEELDAIGGEVIDSEAVRRHLGSDKLDDARRELLTKEFNAHKTAAISRAYSLRRKIWDDAHQESVQQELEIQKARPPEDPKEREAYFAQMATDYGKLAENTALEPSVRLQYLKMAQTLSEHSASEKGAAKRADAAMQKAAIDANEENLARSLATLDLLKMEGSLSQDDANDAQAAIWRKFRALSLGKQLSPSFMRSFETRLSGQLSDQEANAMRKFYQAFGFSTELDKGGEPTATARKDAKKDSEDYYAPLEEDGVKLESRKTRIKAADLLTYGDTLLRTLRALGPDMNREGVVEREIARLKTGWMKGELDKNRDATVRSVMDMQRETRTRWEAAQPDKRSEEDDGRREDGNPAK